MILLDTDHLTVLQIGQGDRYLRLMSRMALSNEMPGTTIVNLEEQMRGWLIAISKERKSIRQVQAYRELQRLFQGISRFTVMPFDEPASIQFDTLVKSKIRIGTMDLKIASITLINDAMLLTANRQDFEKVPGLRFENWLD